jgi:hypothetical protein
MKHLLNFLRGMGEIFQIAPQARAYSSNGGGFLADAANLRGDWRAVGNDLRGTLKRVQSPDDRSR